MSNRRTRIPAGNDVELSKGEIFDVLQNQRRRYVLQYLKRFGGPVDLSELATQVAAWEYHTCCEEVTKDQKKRVYTTLQQTHLRKMAEAGIIQYDTDEQVIEGTPQTDDLTVYLEIVPGGEFPWREYYLSLGAVSSAVIVALWAEVYPLTVLAPLEWATVITGIFTLSAAYHTYTGADMRLDGDEFPPEIDDE